MGEIKYCSIQSWPRGGLSSLPMVSTKRNLTAPPAPLVIGDGNSTPLYNDTNEYLASSQIEIEPHTAIAYQPEESVEKNSDTKM